jgi:hypothetical protein
MASPLYLNPLDLYTPKPMAKAVAWLTKVMLCSGADITNKQ